MTSIRCLFFGVILLFPSIFFAQSYTPFFEKTDTFLKKYVASGVVHYTKIQESPFELIELIGMLEAMDLSAADRITEKAFWINAYNLLVIQSVINAYPITSPLEVNGFFKNKKHVVAGQRITLEELEAKNIIEKYKDPRIHFVLVCAAMGCPPIIATVYHPDSLNQQLDEQTRKAINNPDFIRVKKSEKKIYVSEIFRWYPKDFKKKGGIISFINQYHQEKINKKLSIRFYDYDWRLNDESPTTNKNVIQPYRASTLLYKGQFELKVFNSLFTQRTFDGFDRLNSRSTYFSSFIQLLLGTHQNFNYGVDLVYKSNVLNDFSNSSPFKALLFQQGNILQSFPCNDGQFNRGFGSHCFREGNENGTDTLQNSNGDFLPTSKTIGWAHIGPKFKINPLKRWKGLTFQQTLYIPVQKKVDGTWVAFSQLFFDKPIGSKFQLFAEIGLWTTMHPNFRVNDFYKIFFSFFPTRRWTLYAMTSLPAEYGAGTKFFITKNLEIEFLYTHYLPIESEVGNNRPNTFNLGFRFSR